MKRGYKQLEAFKVEFNANEQVAAGACLVALEQDGTRYQYAGWVTVCAVHEITAKYTNLEYQDTDVCILTGDSDINQYYQ